MQLQPLWAGTAALVALFLFILRAAIANGIPETDLCWMLPVLSHYLDGLESPRLVATLLAPSPNFLHPPILKGVFWLIETGLGLPFQAFLVVAVVLHGINAILLGWLCRVLGLSLRNALVCGVLYATLFLHFHAYFWFPVAQHTYATTFILSVLLLFFLAERRVQQGGSPRLLLALGAAAAVLASLQNSGLIALLLTICAVWYFPIPSRPAMFRRWRWIWMLFLLYPLITMAYAPSDTGISAIARWPFPPVLKAAGLLLLAYAVLAGAGKFLVAGRPPRLFPVFLALSVWGGLALWDHRQVLLPYNALVPWMTVVSSVLDPLRLAMQMDPSDSYYYIPAQVSVFSAALGLFLWGTFFAFARRKPHLPLFGIWYVVVLAYLLLHGHVASGMPFRTQSRYFLYVAPLFAVVFSLFVVYWLTVLCRKSGWKRRTRDGVLVALLLALCLPNLLAIRVALFRGRLTNTYLLYDDYRIAQLVRSDLLSSPTQGDPAHIAVLNAVPTLFDRMPWDPPIDYSLIGHSNLRRFFGEAFGDRRMRSIAINETAGFDGRASAYRLEGGEILDGNGRSIDPFGRLLEAALAEMRQQDFDAAYPLLRKAVVERPFLLNHLLGPGLRFSDVQWITGGDDLRDLFEMIHARYERWGTGPKEKTRRTGEVMRQELSGYALSLFCLSYLSHRAGRLEESRYWLSQIGFLERESGAAYAWLAGIPQIQSIPPLRDFLEKVGDPLFFREPMVWKKEDYAFGRFLIRLILRWDVRSPWDNRFGIVP